MAKTQCSQCKGALGLTPDQGTISHMQKLRSSTAKEIFFKKLTTSKRTSIYYIHHPGQLLPLSSSKSFFISITL